MCVRNIRNNVRGFSLIAIALILVVLGAGVIISLLPNSTSSFEQIDTTQKKLDKIRLALDNYYSMNSTFYPCPASLGDGINSSSFGKQLTTNCLTKNTGGATCATTVVAGAIFFCASSDSFKQIWTGMVPVKQLGLPDDYAFDAWGNRITYVVSNVEIFNVNDIYGNHNLTHMFAFSSGPDGIGSYNRAGSANKACSTLTASTVTEYENCNYTADSNFLYSIWGTNYDDITFRY